MCYLVNILKNLSKDARVNIQCVFLFCTFFNDQKDYLKWQYDNPDIFLET